MITKKNCSSKLQYWTKGTVFYYFPEKIVFWWFLAKIEWISKKPVFFSRGRKKKRSFFTEWVSDLQSFPEKKMDPKLAGKKKNKSNMIFFKKKMVLKISWVRGSWTFPGKKIKNNLFFSFPLFRKIKKTLFPILNECATSNLFPGKNKKRYLWLNRA